MGGGGDGGGEIVGNRVLFAAIHLTAFLDGVQLGEDVELLPNMRWDRMVTEKKAGSSTRRKSIL